MKKYFSVGFVSVLVLMGLMVSNIAFADRDVTSVSLNGIQMQGNNKITVNSNGTTGATINASVKVNITNHSDWKSTGWRINTSPGSYFCVDHPNTNSNGSSIQNFNIISPISSDTYDLYIHAYSSDNCTTGSSGYFKHNNAVTVIVPPDTIPNIFTFLDKTAQAKNSVIESNTITVSGVNTLTPIFISSCTGTNCQYSKNGGVYTSTAGTVVNGNTIKVRQTSSVSDATKTDLVLNIGGISDTFSVTTNDFTPPTTSITSPSVNALLKGTVNIKADASDNVAVSKVEFWHSSPSPFIKIGDGVLSGGVYSINWDTTSVLDGIHSIWTVAYDTTGLNTQSSLISVKVDNTNPALSLPTDITEEAEAPAGNIVEFIATATDENPTDPMVVTCTPNSGSTFGIGSTTVNCSTSDAAGNTTTGSFVVKIQDTTVPVITAPEDQTFEATGSSTTPVLILATVTDIGDANPAIDYSPKDFPLGITEVTWTATDDSGNVATATSNVTIKDTTAPVITIKSSNSIDTWINENFSKPDCMGFDLVDGEVGCEVVSDDVDTGALGTYHITYKATDKTGNYSEKIIEVNVIDKEKPIITRTGFNATVEGGSEYKDEGATAEDKIGNDITESIVTTGLPINTSILGNYDVFYDVVDSWGISATQAKRIVTVVDTTKPVITVLGTNPITIKIGDSYTDEGATASDIISGDLTNSIVTSGDVNTSIADTYTITYTVKDGKENTATSTRTVIVRKLGSDASLSALSVSNGNLSPTFNPETLTYTVTLPYQTTSTPEVSASPTDVNAELKIVNASDVTSVNTENRTTTITVKSEDGEVTKDYTVLFNVAGKPDTTNPVITILGDNPVTIEVGSDYVDAGATALDDVDGDITSKIEINKDNVNIDQIGTYIVTYDVSDSSGNEANQVTRTVKVIKEESHTTTGSYVLGFGPNAKNGEVLGAEKFIFTKFLKIGSHNNEVTELQKFLTNAGYDCGPIDGKFGPLTKAALIKFQIANGLKGDGIVGSKTREVLNK